MAKDANEYYKIKDKSYEKDVTYFASMFEFEQDEDETKIRKLKL